MIRNIVILTLVIFASLTSCDNSKHRAKSENSALQIDTTKAIKIANFWVIPKSSFEINSLNNSSGDTLSIITCSEYVYSPFGSIKNKSEFKSSLLKNFSVRNRIDSMDVGKFEFNILKIKTSKLIFFFDNDPEASKHSDIFKGEIYDSEVQFENGVKIGMSKEEFYKVFFDSFSNDFLEKYKYFVLESCVQDIKHTYSVKNNKLQSINFITDSYWIVNY